MPRTARIGRLERGLREARLIAGGHSVETESKRFLAAYVVLRYDDRSERDAALDLVGRGDVGDRVRSGAVLQELDPERLPEVLVPGDGALVLYALEAPDELALESTVSSLTTASASTVHVPSTTCSCALCRRLQVDSDAVNPSYLPVDRYVVFLHLLVDRGVRWPQLRTTAIASAACTDGTVVVELTGPDLATLGTDAAALLAAPGVLEGRALAGAGSDLRQS